MIEMLFKMVASVKLVFIFLLCFCNSEAFLFKRFRSPYNPNICNELPKEFSYKTLYMTQNVDHFGFDNSQTFQQRYLVADQFWNENGGPIFFYTGNEGDITWFCNNTGFMWETAPEFKALLVFAEHRYYGVSLPYGKESYANASMLNYLTAEQAMADFAELIRSVKQTVPGALHSPVIVMGGSYGGMLSAWMRLKYPNLVLGALAASAPVWMFQDLVPCGSYFHTVQNTFMKASKQCVLNMAASWPTLTNITRLGGLKFISDAFGLCKPLENKYDLQAMFDWLVNVLGDLAMVDYPYPASFLQPLPAWPVSAFCSYLSEPYSDKALVQQLAKAVKMYFNYTGQAPCLNMSQQATADLGDLGWDYQACTEMVMPMCSNNTNMFYNMPWDFDAYSADCKKRWGVTPRENWITLHYWGKNITSASNIIFSNGLLDPWSGGGVLQSLSPSLEAILIPSGAHHLDLRAHNPHDPSDVLAARQQEKNIMRNWLYGSPN